jgi:osomolarity two-component system, sensor histidine kinase SLN1
MPNMDGLEATRLIREAGYKKPIVALSAYSDVTNVKGCHEAGMDDFVSKPIQLARLKLVLKTYCPQIEPSVSTPSSSGTASGAVKTRSTGSRLRQDTSTTSKDLLSPGLASSPTLFAIPLAAPETPNSSRAAEEDDTNISPTS